MTFTIFFAILAIFVSLLIFFENRDPAKTISWLLVMIFLPGIGFVLYLLFGENLRSSKVKKTKVAVAKFLNSQDIKGMISLQILSATQKQALKDNVMFHDLESEGKKKVMQLILNSERSPFTLNNKVDIYTDGLDKFEQMLKDIENARSYIHLEYFIVKNSEIGKKLKDALIKKAKQGVKVRFIYDEIGSFRLFFHPEFARQMKAAGIEFRPFIQVHFPYLHRKFNYRNHRKICVIDGEIGYIGGLNIGDEYVHENKKFGFWRDTHLRIEGESVYMLQTIFLVDYYIGSGQKLNQQELFPSMAYKGDSLIQIVSSGPDSQYESIYNAYFSSIAHAKNTIYIETPYFIPDDALLTALRTAVLSSVDVRIIFPSFPDHNVVYYASLSYLEELLELGCKVYLYEKGFIHSKMILVDEEIASVGTANMDIRSFMINFEVNAFIYDEPTISRLYEIFEADIKDSKELLYSDFKARPIVQKIAESAARLFSPIL